MYEAIDSEFRVRYHPELRGSDGELRKVATLEVWQITEKAYDRHVKEFTSFDAKSIYSKLESLQHKAQRSLFIKLVWEQGGY